MTIVHTVYRLTQSRVTAAARPRVNRNGGGAVPRLRASSAFRTAAGVSNVTRRAVFGSVHRIVPKINGDTPHARSGGADPLSDDPFAINSAGHHSGDRSAVHGEASGSAIKPVSLAASSRP